MKKDIWIAAIARGHNSGICLLKNGEIVFSIEEERLTRQKYDGGPYASLLKVLEYTNKIDHLVIAHTQSVRETAGRVDYTGDDVYTGLARKLGLIERKCNLHNHPQVVDLSFEHHKLHAACAFYRSGFDNAAAVVVDGAGTFIPLKIGDEMITGWETETIFQCAAPCQFKTVYKHIGTRGPNLGMAIDAVDEDQSFSALVTDRAGIVKVYEAVTQYCGFSSIEAGKTMGLFPYGEPNENIPALFDTSSDTPVSNRNVIVPNYPNGALVNSELFKELAFDPTNDDLSDLTKLKNRRDLAYACQQETQDQVLRLIIDACKKTGEKNIVLTGGYALNCVANYFYLDKIDELGINLYVEPISNDAGTAIGAALLFYHRQTGQYTNQGRKEELYLGPKYNFSIEEINDCGEGYGAEITDADNDKIVDLLINKNIVAVFQGRSENGPRALGNRSLLFDPSFKDAKDFVNSVKRREYFRPFAGSILEEDAKHWFDLRGMDSSPSMMYAVKCRPEHQGKISGIVHVDGTCRIQTVNRDQNPLYYDLITAFKEKTGIPIVFNTSFNLGGEPLVETLEDALRTLKESEIEYLYLPEYKKLLTIKNQEDIS